MNRAAMVFLASVVALSGCGAQPQSTAAAEEEGERATVRFLDLEGGCWALDLGSVRVQPINLPENFKKDGLEVTVKLRDAEAMMSVCQVGPLRHIERIEKR